MPAVVMLYQSLDISALPEDYFLFCFSGEELSQQERVYSSAHQDVLIFSWKNSPARMKLHVCFLYSHLKNTIYTT